MAMEWSPNGIDHRPRLRDGPRREILRHSLALWRAALARRRSARPHPQGVVHRDVKPPNLSSGGRIEDVKVLDLGSRASCTSSAATMTGVAGQGTPATWPPSRCASDLRAMDERRRTCSQLGCVLARVPDGCAAAQFEGRSRVGDILFGMILFEEGPSPSALLRADLSAENRGARRTGCCRRTPTGGPRGMGEVSRRARGGSPAAGAREPRRPPPRAVPKASGAVRLGLGPRPSGGSCR
jgi:serine/threonine protein kinase